MKTWFKKQMGFLSLALANVEKNALGQKGDELDVSVSQEQRHTQGTLADSLKQGRVTQEVMNLRWRTYKILEQADGLTTRITGYDEDDMPITETRKIDKKKFLKKIRQDEFDNYELEMVIDNTEITMSTNEAMGNSNISLFENPISSVNEDGISVKTHGEIKGDEYFITNKTEKPIFIERKNPAKFQIENFTKKLHVRKISDSKRLLEFYVSLYPDEYNRTSRFFISEIKKVIENGLNADMLEIENVKFITYKSIGVNDFLEYQYNDIIFDKIIEFNGHYVIKFIGNVSVDGLNIMLKHKQDELDKKYENKEAKNKRV